MSTSIPPSEIRLTEELASFFAELRWDSVPDCVGAEAKRVILDTLGCIVAASASEFGPMVREVASLFGATTSDRQTMLGASYAYGRFANLMDLDESIALGYHFGPSAVAAALAIGQARQISGKEFVLAVVAGYELGARIAEAMGPYGPPRLPRKW